MLAAGRSMAAWWSGCRSSSPPCRYPQTKSLSSLSVVFNCMAKNKADVMRWWSTPHHRCLSGSRQSLPFFSVAPKPTNNVAPLPLMKCHHRHRLHVIIAAACSKECWVRILERHHHRAGPPILPQDVALDLPFLSAIKSANL